MARGGEREIDEPDGLGRAARWLLVVALWTILPLLSTTTFYLRFHGPTPPVPWGRFFVNQLVYWGPWIPLTPLVLGLGRRFSCSRSRRWRDAAIHLACGSLLGVGFFLYTVGLEMARGLELSAVTGSVLAATLASIVPVHIAIYGILVGVSLGLAYHQKNRERDAHLARARLRALKAQVHPHFLFNTLHAISSLMEDDVPAARRMIARLSELLRASLASSGSHEVPLAEEIELVRLYLDIEEVRFADRLRVSYRVDPGVRDALVPHLVLQPLVENAIRHGISRDSESGRLEVTAGREGNRLRLTVADDGPGLNGGPPSEGVGLANTRARLAQMYGDAARLEIRRRQPRGCEAVLEVPIRWTPSAP